LGGHPNLGRGAADHLEVLWFGPMSLLGREQGQDGDPLDLEIGLGPQDIAGFDPRRDQRTVQAPFGLPGSRGPPCPRSVGSRAGELDLNPAGHGRQPIASLPGQVFAVGDRRSGPSSHAGATLPVVAARPVLLVHGFVESGRTVIELDLPGHGNADKPHDPEAYADLAGVVASAIPQGEVVDAIGFSMGARLLLEVAAAEPERFGRVVVAGVGASVFQEGDTEPAALAVERGGVIEGDHPAAQAFSVFARADGNDPAALAACLRRWRPAMRAEELANLRRPVLVVLGTKDFAGPAGPLLDALPDARLVELAGADHFGTPKDFRFIDAAVAFLEAGDDNP
jgi:pimeloyl-ACP methyl ester carboxylesterase